MWLLLVRNKGIGFKNKIPWGVTKDIKYFRILTQGYFNDNAIIMGKNTAFSIPRSLPKRTNYVVSSTLLKPKTQKEKFITQGGYGNFNIIQKSDLHMLTKKNYGDIWIIGGAELYSGLINSHLINAIYYTDIDKEFECDTFFPVIPSKFKKIYHSPTIKSEDIDMSFKVYVNEQNVIYPNYKDYKEKAKVALHYTNSTLGIL